MFGLPRKLFSRRSPLLPSVLSLTAIDLSLAILATSLTLYGFVIAYYAFSRGLHEQEKALILGRIEARTEPIKITVEAAEKLWTNFYARAALVDLFLALCTLIVAVSVAAANWVFLWIGWNSGDYLLTIETLCLTGLFVAVAVWIGAVCRYNFAENFRQFGKRPGIHAKFWPRLRDLWAGATRPLQ